MSAIGARIPQLALRAADAHVEVDIEGSEATSLLWAFLRRGRLVLAGLPGGGKSTEIKKLAARLCALAHAPLPVPVSLPEVNARDRATTSFRDQLITVAVRDVPAEYRDILRAEIEHRLVHGGVTLLLDSLDETYGDRGTVVSDIESLIAEISPDTDILLATRDIAYADAQRLSWQTARLGPPTEIGRTVRAILEAASTQDNKMVADPQRWIDQRIAWIDTVLEQDHGLRETPLMPVLLAMLATEREQAALPVGRARILAAIIEDLLAPKEVKRQKGNTHSEPQQRKRQVSMARAFRMEATALLRGQKLISRDVVIKEVADDLRQYFDLSEGDAKADATDAVHFFDEAGIFVIAGASQTVAPRVALFAEIGDALRIADKPHDAESWVAARIDGRQAEPLILAAALNDQVAAVLASAVRQRPNDRAVMHAAVQAVTEGAHMHERDIRSLCEALINDVATGDRASWRSWRELSKLPVPPDLAEPAISASTAHSPDHATVATATLDIRFRSRAALIAAPQHLLDVLTLHDLPKQGNPSETDAPVSALRWPPVIDTSDIPSPIDRALVDVQYAAARILLGQVPAATALVVECARNEPMGNHRLLRLLGERRFTKEASTVASARVEREDRIVQEFVRASGRAGVDLDQNDRSRDTVILSVLAARSQAELSWQQRNRLQELADFVETLDLSDLSASRQLLALADATLHQICELAARLYRFDLDVLAAQAQIILDRTAGTNVSAYRHHAAYDCLFDGSVERTSPDWTGVHAEDAVPVIMKMFTLAGPQASVAAKALWYAPSHVAQVAVPLLRDFISRTRSGSIHHRLAASVLCTLVDGPEPAAWVSSLDPGLRAVAATMLPPEAPTFDHDLRQLIDDADAHVQESALRRYAKEAPPDLHSVLRTVANRPRPGWTCHSCRTLNLPSGQPTCANESCGHRGPDPHLVAAELLVKLAPAECR
ncbi:NACHT domain-containing protein [Amycolatopsis sp. NPDC059657]|uniref:NACHT domain-containing protein n=1 Tax=Amycolatopsis sp. NPDC059657 TaxID=3346899 RepID=UPI00366B6AE7